MGRRDTATNPAPSPGRQRGPPRAQRAVGARRPRGPATGPARDAAARSPQRRRILTGPGRARARPARPWLAAGRWPHARTVGSMASGSSSKMLRRLRNEVGELGGDAFVVVGGDRFELQAEAYRCAALER